VAQNTRYVYEAFGTQSVCPLVRPPQPPFNGDSNALGRSLRANPRRGSAVLQMRYEVTSKPGVQSTVRISVDRRAALAMPTVHARQ
jgi:hypothetical protein